MSTAEAIVTVEFQWQGLGSVQRDEQGLLGFRPLPDWTP